MAIDGERNPLHQPLLARIRICGHTPHRCRPGNPFGRRASAPRLDRSLPAGWAGDYRHTMSDAVAVLNAAKQRARALVAGDAEKLRELMHPDSRWTTHRGDVLDRDSYIEGNTNGELRWLGQRL